MKSSLGILSRGALLGACDGSKEQLKSATSEVQPPPAWKAGACYIRKEKTQVMKNVM